MPLTMMKNFGFVLAAILIGVAYRHYVITSWSRSGLKKGQGNPPDRRLRRKRRNSEAAED